jgi:hypothetical protein
MDQQTSTCHFMAAVVAFYERDKSVKERHMNVLLETPSANLTKDHLGQIQRSALTRLHAENNVDPKTVQDVVILNVCLLGVMPAHVFHGTEAAPTPVASVN